ncbi:MAG: HAMP domain-containing histidine kinase [Desulfobulbaceae bacterium]|nr:HAMP domain-containing histidine kinase [Desulfobulbaceae bacterium]
MKSPRYLPLQWKFICAASAAILVFATVFGAFAASRNRTILYDAIDKQGKVLAQTVASLIINELIYEKLGLVEEGGLIDNYLQELFKRGEMDYLYLAVLDEGNRVISHSDFREYGKVYRDKTFDFSESAEVVVREIAMGEFRPDALEFAAPLSIGGKNWGVFLFAVTLDKANERVRDILLEIWLMSLAALFFGFVLIWFLSRRFILPITSLAAVMQKVDGETPQEKVPVRGNDELAQLAENFNAMNTRLSLANDEMKKTHGKLLQSEKLATLGILSSSVAHRINNPLGGLQNCIAMLRRRGDDPQFRMSYLDLMQEGVESIEQTVAQLLWSAGKSRSEEPRANLAEILAAVVRFIGYHINKTAIDFSSDVPADLIVPVTPHDLNQILVNLLINAIQAMPQGGALRVGARKEEKKVIITVADTGIGIDAQAIDKIFDLFYTSKKSDEGTGLGLWMTYELVKRNKGDIQVASRVGRGTTFTVTFPEAS